MELNLDSLTPDMLLAVWIVFAARLIIWAFYANTVRKTLQGVAEQNRFLQPAKAWLLVIPLFNIYWNFVVVRALSNSLNNEFFDRKIAEEENPGLTTGLLYCWIFMLSHIPFPAFILLVFLVMGIVYFIQYWIKINHFRLLIQEHDRFVENQKHQSRPIEYQDEN